MTMKAATGIDRKPSKIRRLSRLRLGQWSLLIEAATALAKARLIVATRSPADLMPRLGRMVLDDLPTDYPACNAEDERRAVRIGWAVRRAAGYMPFRAMCFEQALAARAMLDRRGIPATVHYGVAAGAGQSLLAHAWTRAGAQPITGYPLQQRFQEIARFASRQVQDT